MTLTSVGHAQPVSPSAMPLGVVTQWHLLFPTNEQVGLANRGHRFVLVSAEVAQTACLPKFCHENVIAHRIRELQNHFTSRISMSFLLLDVTGDKHYGVSEELS